MACRMTGMHSTVITVTVLCLLAEYPNAERLGAGLQHGEAFSLPLATMAMEHASVGPTLMHSASVPTALLCMIYYAHAVPRILLC